MGVDAALDRIVDLTGCSEIQLTPSYHVSNYFLPHNLKSPIRFGENGAVFFTPTAIALRCHRDQAPCQRVRDDARLLRAPRRRHQP